MIITKSDPFTKEEIEKLRELDNRQTLGALAIDLKRIALGIHRGSMTMASRFSKEAEKRLNEVDRTTLLPYMKKTLGKIQSIVSTQGSDKKAEDALMYSVIVQNYTQYK